MNLKQYLLLKLSEECAEVSQRAAKQMQFGRDESQAGNPVNKDKRVITDEMRLTNGPRLRGEINDLLGIVALLEEVGELPLNTPEDLETALDDKRKKIAKYLTYSVELGMVERHWNDIL